MKLAQVAGLTDPGRVRRRNEDSFVCDPPLFAVADGMGGAQAGEIASRLAASAFHEYHEADSLDPEARLRSIIQEANRRIYARASSDPHASGMGTTITAALVSGARISVGHVGDSRAYLFRDEVLEQLTEDHSLVADLVRSGRLTPEEAEVHPQRSVITRALGTDAAVTVDSFSVEAKAGDVYLLCSDGLTTMLGSDPVRKALAETSSLEEAARRLIGEANAAGGEDNVTVVLFAVAEAGEDEDTLSGLEGFRVMPEPVPESDPDALPSGGMTVVERAVLPPRTAEVLPPPPRRTKRWIADPAGRPRPLRRTGRARPLGPVAGPFRRRHPGRPGGRLPGRAVGSRRRRQALPGDLRQPAADRPALAVRARGAVRPRPDRRADRDRSHPPVRGGSNSLVLH